jgi:hypothetical protein
MLPPSDFVEFIGHRCSRRPTTLFRPFAVTYSIYRSRDSFELRIAVWIAEAPSHAPSFVPFQEGDDTAHRWRLKASMYKLLEAPKVMSLPRYSSLW